MSVGGGPYYTDRCPECGGVTWNGECEDCNYVDPEPCFVFDEDKKD